MSIATLIIGETGTGKTTSLRNLTPETTLLIQALKKPLPFKSANWTPIVQGQRGGSVLTTDNPQTIVSVMKKSRRPVVVIDDFQYVLANEYMRRTAETGYQKFTDIGRNAWDILNCAMSLSDRVRVYILSHSTTDDFGHTRIKTIGKMLDEKITVEGMFSIVLRTVVRDGEYWFSTRNSGNDTVKTPMDMFPSELIPNDLKAVDDAICAYYSVTPATPLRAVGNAAST